MFKIIVINFTPFCLTFNGILRPKLFEFFSNYVFYLNSLKEAIWGQIKNLYPIFVLNV